VIDIDDFKFDFNSEDTTMECRGHVRLCRCKGLESNNCADQKYYLVVKTT